MVTSFGKAFTKRNVLRGGDMGILYRSDSGDYDCIYEEKRKAESQPHIKIEGGEHESYDMLTIKIIGGSINNREIDLKFHAIKSAGFLVPYVTVFKDYYSIPYEDLVRMRDEKRGVTFTVVHNDYLPDSDAHPVENGSIVLYYDDIFNLLVKTVDGDMDLPHLRPALKKALEVLDGTEREQIMEEQAWRNKYGKKNE